MVPPEGDAVALGAADGLEDAVELGLGVGDGVGVGVGVGLGDGVGFTLPRFPFAGGAGEGDGVGGGRLNCSLHAYPAVVSGQPKPVCACVRR